MFAAICKDATGARDVITIKLPVSDGKLPVDLTKELMDKSYLKGDRE